MSEENANVGESTEAAESNDTSKKVTEKISEYSGKVDAVVESALGIIGNRPWDSWLDTANKYISKFLPAAIALAGVLACLTGLITMIKADAPFSWVVKQLFILVPVLFAMHLAPKALALTRSFIEKGEPAVIRPELMYIMKVICGIGGILLGVYLLLNFDKDLVVSAVVAIIFAVLMIICLEVMHFFIPSMGERQVTATISAADDKVLQTAIESLGKQVKWFAILREDQLVKAEISLCTNKKESPLALLERLSAMPGIRVENME